MAREIAQERCFNHGRREAAAMCLSCHRFFCRECVTEHQGRLLCASCLARESGTKPRRRARLAGIGRAAMLALSVLTLWLFFYLIGQGLLALPSSFHQGTVWQSEESD
jgi:hypothetical protein